MIDGGELASFSKCSATFAQFLRLMFGSLSDSAVVDSEGHALPAQEVRQARLLQIVENTRDGAAVRERVIANLRRADELAASSLIASRQAHR